MSFAYHGNWCGPGWTAGKYKSAKELKDDERDVPAVDKLDQACKTHDINIKDGNPNANEIFIKQTKGLGLKADVAATLVALAGPTKGNHF